MTNPRFGLIPLPLSMKNQAVPSEFMTDPNTGHLYIKQADGSAKSKTVELENRIVALEKRATEIEAFNKRNEVYNDTVSIPGGRLEEFMFKSDMDTANTYNISIFKRSDNVTIINTNSHSEDGFAFDLNVPLISTYHDVYYIGIEYATTENTNRLKVFANIEMSDGSHQPIETQSLSSYIDEQTIPALHFFKIIPTVPDNNGLNLKPKIRCYGETIFYNIFIIRQKLFMAPKLTDTIKMDASSYNSEYFKSKNRGALKNLTTETNISNQTRNLLSSRDASITIDGRQLCLQPGWYSVNILIDNSYPLTIDLYYKQLLGSPYTSHIHNIDDVGSSIQNYRYITCALAIPSSDWYMYIYPTDKDSAGVTANIRDITLTKLNTALYDHSKL